MVNKPRADIFIPVYNNGHELEASLSRALAYGDQHLADYDWKIIVADNCSRDNTAELVKSLMEKHNRLGYYYIPQKGRGIGLKKSFQDSSADFMCYMDVDLSTNLAHLPPMLASLSEYDLVIGSRWLEPEKAKRSFKRRFLSKWYNALVRKMLGTKFSDAQCGFKGINRRVQKNVLPHIQDSQWFFDTELLYYVEKSKRYRLLEIPVEWQEDPDSGVRLTRTVIDFVSGLRELRRRTIDWERI